MKTTFFAFVIAASASISLGPALLSQQANANAQENASGASAGPEAQESTGVSANESAKTTYRPAYSGWGDAAASHAWEMSSITGELQGKLDSKTAKQGDRVVLKTTEKVQTSDGTLIPRGSRLIGHVTEVQAQDSTHAIAQMGIAFDHVELKDGKSVAIFTLIRHVYPNPTINESRGMGNDSGYSGGPGSMGGPMGAGSPGMGGGRGNGGSLGSPGGTLNGSGSMPGGTIDRTNNGIGTNGPVGSDGIGTIDDPAAAGLGSSGNGTVHSAGHGDESVRYGAHGAAAARAIPHPSGIPGVLLAGNSTASGLLIATKMNIEFESGTEMQLGIVAD